jgi:hypothetical protein
MKTIINSFLITIGLLLLTSGARAQSYSIDWHTVAGGGGTSTGGVYSVGSTIGQHAAGVSMTGGGYDLTGGFWGLFATPTSSPSTLNIFLTETNTVVIAWSGTSSGGTVQQATDLGSGTWSPLTNIVITVNGLNQIVLPSPSGDRFYRLQNP